MSNEAEDLLLDTLDTVAARTDGETTRLGTIFDALEERGYGPLIMILSVLVVMPTGMIPGVPAIVGLCLVLIGLQMALGRARPWFPARLEGFELDDAKLSETVEKARPWAKRLSVVLRPRLGALTGGAVSNRLIAAALCAAGVVMVPLGFVPGLPLALGLATLLLGLGMTVRDGLVIFVGYGVFVLGVYAGWQAW